MRANMMCDDHHDDLLNCPCARRPRGRTACAHDGPETERLPMVLPASHVGRTCVHVILPRRRKMKLLRRRGSKMCTNVRLV